MSRTPAAHLAQLKQTWPEWNLSRTPDGFLGILRGGRGEPLEAGTIDELDAQLRAWDQSRNLRRH